MNLFMKPGIAGAVAREIRRGSFEGHAYKAEWDRRGSDAIKHGVAASDDALVMLRAAAGKAVRHGQS